MRPAIKTVFATLFPLLIISCTKEKIDKSLPVTAQSNNNSTNLDSFYVGEKYGGGIIFYIDETGQHGLIVGKTDLTFTTWYNGVFTVTGATSINYGKGLSNTKKIVKSQEKSGNYAALQCFNYKASGYAEWYLGTKSEVSKLYSSGLSGLANEYWTSSEYDSLHAWVCYRSSSAQPDVKNRDHNVRPIRSF